MSDRDELFSFDIYLTNVDWQKSSHDLQCAV